MKLKSLLLSLIFSLAGCFKTTTEVLNVGTNIWPGYEPLYIARELGYLDANLVQLVEYGSATQVANALKTELINAAALTLDEYIRLEMEAGRHKVVLIMDESRGADVLMSRQDIKSLAGLKNQIIGYEKTALGAYMRVRFQEKMKKNGIDISNIKFKHIEVNSHFNAMKNKEVDAVITFEPVRSQLLSLKVNELFSSKDIPGEILDVLFINQSDLENNKKSVRHLIEAWFKALEFIRRNPDESFKIMARRLKISEDEIKKSLNLLSLPSREENLKVLSVGSNKKIIDLVRNYEALFLREEIIKKKIDADKLFLNNLQEFYP